MPTYTRRILQTTPLYQQPDEKSTRLGEIMMGRYVRVLDIQRSWLYVEDMANVSQRGFLSIKALTPPRGGMRAAATPVRQPTLEEEADSTPSGPPAEDIVAVVAAPGDGRDLPPPTPISNSPEAAALEPGHKISKTTTYIEKVTANVWNSYGGLLAALGGKYNIDPVVAAAVMAVESGGNAFDNNGRLIIRFENHLFYDYWGKANQDVYGKYFTFNTQQRWKEHTFRTRVSDPFESFHGNQDKEWLAFGHAFKQSPRAALASISMGAPQILGSNFKRVGYDSPESMYAAFGNKDEGARQQVIALFKFIENDPYNRGIPALRNEDYTAFAEMYNGSGQAQTYGNLITERVRLLRVLLAA
jgi:hypothetical protein